MSDFDPIRDCPHGRQKGKCDSCDLEQAADFIEQQQQRIEELEHQLTQYRIDNLKIKEDNNELAATVERLRADNEKLQDEVERAFYNGYVRWVENEQFGKFNHAEFLPEIAEDECRKYLDSEFNAITHNYPSDKE